MANAKAKAKTKTPPVNPKAEIYDAVVALAKEKDISVDYIVTAIEDACMTAFKKRACVPIWKIPKTIPKHN